MVTVSYSCHISTLTDLHVIVYTYIQSPQKISIYIKYIYFIDIA